MEKKSTVQKVVHAIQQATFATKHTFGNEKEENRAGLQRNFSLEQSIANDGFNVSVGNGVLTLTYHLELKRNGYKTRKDVEDDIGETISKIKAYLKSEYKKITGSSLSLRKIDGEKGELVIDVNPISAIRTQILAKQSFSLPAAKEEKTEDDSSKDSSVKSDAKKKLSALNIVEKEYEQLKPKFFDRKDSKNIKK